MEGHVWAKDTSQGRSPGYKTQISLSSLSLTWQVLPGARGMDGLGGTAQWTHERGHGGTDTLCTQFGDDTERQEVPLRCLESSIPSMLGAEVRRQAAEV